MSSKDLQVSSMESFMSSV